MSDEKPATVIGNYQLTAQLTNGRSIQIAGYLVEGEDTASINNKLDLCQEAIERQRTRCEIPELEAKREQMIKSLGQMREVLADLVKKQQDGVKLTSQEKLNLQNMQVNVGKVSEEIEKGEVAIAEAKRKVGLA